MKTNKYLLKISVFLVCVLLLTVSAEAQKKKKTTKTNTNTTTTATEIKDGASKVSIQIKNLTKFIFSLGVVSQPYEDLDAEIKAGKASKKGTDLYAKKKAIVLTTIRNLRAGLAALEIEFRTKTALKTYLPQIQGIADLCGQSEDLVNSGKFIESGKPLLLVVEKLSDTLAVMP